MPHFSRLAVLTALTSAFLSTYTAANDPNAYHIVGYYTNWSNKSLTQLTLPNIDVINYAFLQANQDGTIGSLVNANNPSYDKTATWSTVDTNNFQLIPKLKQINPKLKFLVSVGGWTRSENFSAIAASPQLTQAFVTSAVNLIKANPGIDGIDIDWEYPVSGGDNIPHVPADKQNYVNLVKALRTGLDAINGTHYIISIAGAHNSKQGDEGSVDNFDVKGLLQSIDWINIMAYDMHQSTSEPSITNIDGALYQTPYDPSVNAGDDSISASIADYKKQNLTAAEVSKLILGVPLYGFAWKNVTAKGADPDFPGLYATANGKLANPYAAGSDGLFNYATIVNKLITDQNLQPTCSANYKFCTYYSPTTAAFLTFTDETTALAKADFIKEQGLGGAMFWELNGDTYDQRSLVYNMGLALGKPVVVPTPPPPVWKMQVSNTGTSSTATFTIVINNNVYEAFLPALNSGQNQTYSTDASATLADIQTKYGSGPFPVMITPNGDSAKAFWCADNNGQGNKQLVTFSADKTPNIMVNPDTKACAIGYY